MRTIEVKVRTPTLIKQLIEVWQNSVKATHLFLSKEEINNIKEYVPQALKGVSHLVIVENENNEPVAFMGIEDKKLVDYVINNKKTGKCPMENKYKDEDDINKIYTEMISE